jgi:FMN-dependent oxidoreductase (nitrilotriacetate monooxygenase family)
MFHIGWFLGGSTAQAWNTPWSGNIGTTWRSPSLYVDIARELERGCFDYILLEDNVFVADGYGGSMEIYLKNANQSPRIDPMMLAPMMAAATQHIGLVPTITTMAYHPYLLARLMGSLDSVTGGRAGWNMVTGSSDRAAQNFGMDAMIDHDLRYEQAEEFCDLAFALWDSWAPDSVVADRETGVFADHKRVSTIDFEGRWYSSRGPLNSGPPIQGRPVLAQAGNSDRGREFAARYAETIVGSERSIDKQREFRDDVRARATRMGRNPDDIKVLFTIEPIIGATVREAEEKAEQRALAAAAKIELRLAQMSKTIGYDFSALPLDEPFDPEFTIESNGTQHGVADLNAKLKSGLTLREAVLPKGATTIATDGVQNVGTASQVAASLAEAVHAIDGDGWLLGSGELTRRSVVEIVDGLVPELQRNGWTRTSYAGSTLRENLLAF